MLLLLVLLIADLPRKEDSFDRSKYFRTIRKDSLSGLSLPYSPLFVS